MARKAGAPAKKGANKAAKGGRAAATKTGGSKSTPA